MKWQFWRKDDTLKKLDPHMFAVMMVQKMANREYPFNRWRVEENPIPDDADAFVEIAVNVYQLCVLLDALERKFGADVAGIVRLNLITVMDKAAPTGNTVKDFFDAVRVGRALPERERFFADNPNIQVDCNVAKAFLAVASEPEDVKNALFPKLGQSLTLARISAESAFNPLMTEIDFRPESIFGFRKIDEIQLNWSAVPGCFERQLQRRHNNALFPEEKRRVTTDEVVEAKSRDQADLETLRAESQTFIDEITSGPNRMLTYSDLNKWRETVEEFLMRASAIGDIANELKVRLRAVYDGIVTSLRDYCPPEHKAQLEMALEKSESYQRTWSNQFLVQFNRKDTPINPDDLLPSLLIENLETVQVVAGVMPDENRRGLGKAAVALVEKAKKEGYNVPDAWEKIRAFS